MEQIQLNNQNTLTSIEVAGMVERQHNELLKSIRQYIEYLAEGEIPHGEFFTESTYKDSNNQVRPSYLITRKGCAMIANKLTGAKGTLFTAKYVTRFEQMEQTLLQGLSPELQAIIGQDKKLTQHDIRITHLEDTKHINSRQKSKITKRISELVIEACGGKTTNAYLKLSKKLYSNINRKLFDKFDISERADIPFIKYDEAFDFISSWYPDFDLAAQIKDINGNAA